MARVVCMRDVKKSTPARTPFRPSCVQKRRGLTNESVVCVGAPCAMSKCGAIIVPQVEKAPADDFDSSVVVEEEVVRMPVPQAWALPVPKGASARDSTSREQRLLEEEEGTAVQALVQVRCRFFAVWNFALEFDIAFPPSNFQPRAKVPVRIMGRINQGTKKKRWLRIWEVGAGGGGGGGAAGVGGGGGGGGGCEE